MRNKLIEFRKKIGLSQTEMGEIFFKSRSQWGNIENGKRKGDPEMWIDIGIKFELTFEQVKSLMEIS